MDVRDFMIEPDDKGQAESARTDRAKESALEILGSATKVYEKLKQGLGNPAFLAGKAWAYLASFKALARALGLREDAYLPAVRNLEAKLTPYLVEHEAPPPKKTVVIQHKADPEKLKVEEHKIAVREVAAEARKEPDKAAPGAFDARGLPNEQAIMIEDIANALVNGLNYGRTEARKRAEAVYKPGMPLEELISEACRVNL